MGGTTRLQQLNSMSTASCDGGEPHLLVDLLDLLLVVGQLLPEVRGLLLLSLKVQAQAAGPLRLLLAAFLEPESQRQKPRWLRQILGAGPKVSLEMMDRIMRTVQS